MGSSIAFDRPVARRGRLLEVLAEPLDRLVVEGVDVELADAERTLEARVVADPDAVRRDVAGLVLAVGDGPGQVGDVLVQCPAADDVERLHPAADGEDRHLPRVGPPRDGELEAVEVGLDRPELGMGPRAVGLRVEVGAAGEAHAVEAVEQWLDRLESEWRNDEREGAGRLDGAQVGEPECHLEARWIAAGSRIDALGAPDLGGGDADQRPIGAGGERPGVHASTTQVSLPPPPREELTIISPASTA